MATNKNTDWRANVAAMMTDPNYAEKMASVVNNTRKVNTNLMNKSEESESSLSLDKPTSKPLDLSRVQEMQTEQAARATMPDDDSGVADLAVQAYADARKQIGDEVSKQMADDKSMAFVHPMAAGILRSAEAMKAGDVQKTFDRMLENNAVRQAIETKANSELTAALGKNPALTEEQQKDIYNKSVQRQIDAISGRVNQYLLDVNAPKSEGEYVLKSAVGNSLIGKSMLQAARNISGLESAEYDYGQQALADYDANKASWYAKGGAAIGGLLLDAPMMQGIGSASSATLGRGTSMALGKAASNTLWGKMLIGQATAAGTLGGYNFTSTLASQMMGNNFDAGELFSSTMHGVGLGALTGGMTPLLRGATAGMGAVGKTATMGGGILGEAAAFSAPEWVETFNENPYDFKAYAEALGTNVMVIAGLKASNLPKTVQEYKEWWNQGKTSGFTDVDYKALSDYALAKGYANDGAFTYQDGVYQRSIADRATGGRNILTLTKLEGGGEKTLAMEMYQDPNVPLSMKTKIAAKMGLPAPNPVLPNAVEARDNVVNTYYEYREQMSDGTYVTRRILVDSKEMPSKRKARAAASEFGRTKARQNSIIQSEAEANTDATNAIVMARLTEQAWRSGANVSDEVARMYDIAQRAQRGEASAEDIAYYQSVMEGTTEVTDRIKADIKAKTGVDIDEVLKQEGTFNTAQDKALTMYTEALASLKDNSKPTTERGTTASQASIADYIELKGMGIEQTKQLLNDPTAKVAAEKDIRNKYALWLKYFDGQMSEEQLASRLGYNLDSTKGLVDFVNEEAFFRGKAANRIAYNAANAAKRLLEQGSGGVRFTEDGKVKLQGVPYSIAVDESIVDRYRAAQQGSGENYQRIANDALKDIIRQSEQPIEEMLQQMATDEQAIVSEPQTEQEAVTQQMVDNRLAEIDTDLQGIEADGIQRVNINDKPAMIIKGRIATLDNGEIDRTNSSTEVAYIPLDENGRPIKNEQGKPVVEVGVKPSNVRVSEVEPWRTVEDYKRAEEQRIRDNNRITDEAMAQVDAEGGEVKEELPTLDKVVVEPKDADELIAMCDGDKGLALDVAVDELAKAQAAKGKGASTAETIDINRRIRTYQQIVDRLSASEMPDAAAAEVEPEQKGEATKAEPQVTDDMEFVYQQGLDENHDGMEPMQMADGRYKWVGLQRGELTATMGERDVELLDGLAKKLGVAVIPINVADSAVNGYYRDGNIYVNTNRGAEWTMRWVAGHEMLHDVAKKSPEAYDAYKQAVLDMWGEDYIDDQVKQIIDDYAASGKTIDREQALTELVNDFGGELFNSRDGLNILDNILKTESKRGNVGFVDTIKQWWERLKEWFSGTPYYKNVEKLLKDAYSEAIANAEEFRRNQEMDKGVSSVTDAARVEGAAIDFSIKTEPQVAQRLREYAESEDGKKHGWDKEKIESIIDETEDLIDAIHNSLQGNQRYDAWADKNPTMRVDWRDGELKQTVTWSRGNVEYKYDMSADLLCINNEALEDVLASPAMVQIVRGMDTLSKNGFTSDDYLRIYQVLRDKGFVVPCAGCFDAAARFKMLPSVAKNFADLVNKTIDERNADPEAFDAKVKAMAKGETTIEGLPTSANTKQDAIMIGVAGDKLTEHITSEQLLSAQGQTDMLATLGGIFRAWQRTGAGRPKDKLLPEPYVGDINSTSTTILGKYGEKTPSYRDIYVNQGTGLRRNSHSEFRPLLAIDEIQFMRDAFAKGLTVFKYMKELDDVRLFGNMGVKFNMSFFPAFAKDGVAAGLDANGNYIASEESVGSREFAYMGEDGRTHFDGMKGWQEAQKYTNENVSLSSVVFSVPHLIKSLTDVPTPSDKSGMWGSLIPFYSTGATSAHLALQGLGRARANGIGHPFSEAMHDYNKGVTNFEDVQNDRFGEGWVIVEGKKAGTAIKDGHKLEFVNGTHMYNERLGVHLFKDGYIFDKDIKKKDNYGNGKVNTKNVKKYMTKFYVDYNDKVRELGGDYAYKDAADYYLRELPKIGLIPRFSFEVPESIYLEMCKAANVDPKHPKLGWKGEGNAWNPIDAESYYSLFCDYGMTDPKTGKWSPHKPIGNVDENGNRVFRLPDNAVQIVKDAVDKYSARRDKEESRINDVYEEFLKRSVKDGRLSEAEAQNLLSEISADADYSISRKIDEKYPNWLEGTTTSSGKHSTQVAGTIGTYRKVGKWIKENLGNDIRILDASSGMGLGTEALRKDGMQIDDVEPYQSEERKKTNPATFSSYKDINGKYDFIISNAVLNVIPDDWRSNVLHDMVARLNNGGRLFVNTRKAGEEKTIKDKIELDSPQEILVKRNGKIASYQRFFTPNELKEWVENELGEGYSVEVANEKNSGTKGLAAVVVRKLGEQPTDPNGGKPSTEFSIKADKQKQFDIISSINPMRDDYHTGIRKVDDILTLQEAIEASKQENGEGIISTYPDVDESVYNEALQSGKIKVYSSKPIENGAFVGPSMMQAKDYAGGGKVYSKEVNVSDIAWINADEGVYASLGKRADESVLDYAKRMSEETGKKNLLNGGSYFSGGGLLEEGLKGIVNPTIAVEFNQKVAGVYRNNFGEHIVTADVRNVDPVSLVKNIDGPVAYFHASPVCKNFSKAKQSAEELPLDKATAQSTAEFISKVRPKIVTIENVKGYRDSESMKIILDELKKQGYNYDVDVYNAADYGAYTSRERLIVRAVRDWPLPAKPMVMLADDRPSGWLEAVADIIDTLPEKKGGVAKWMDERLMAMGIDYRNIDKPLYVFGSGYSKDRIGYAFADELVPTLRTKGGDVIVMPDGRVLKATPRVLARISGMSDEYEMPKTDDLAHTIVGNGIPVQLTKAVMGSLIENVKSDLDAGNTEYSIIGKRGATNLDKRDETSIRVDNMVTAEEMEKAGKDAKTIRMATGWERGADGKWRYEVKDLSMLPAEQWIGKRGKKLSDIVENADELFAAYPELAKVKIKEGNGKTYGGSYSSGVITLDTYLAKLWMKRLPDSLPRANKYMNEALIHEIQHYIQEEEGFAKGGNESMVLDKDAVSKISALIDDSNKLATQYNNMIERGVYEGREAVKDEIIALRAKANAIRNGNRLGSYGYKRLAGEAEARNAEKRLGMTEEERKNSLLADTEDVGRDEQIVYGNTDDEYSIKIRGKEYRNDGYTQREGVNLSIGANEALKSGMTDIGMDGLFGDFIAEKGLGKFDGEYHHVGQKFNKHYFAKLNDGVTLASARKAYKKYLEDKSNKEVADVLKKYPDAIPMDGGIYRDYKEVAYAGGKFWFVPRGENEPRPTIYRELPQGEDVQFSIKGGNTPKNQADEVARLKQRIEQLSQEKDAIAEDGAKVKDIASEMTSFIKQNISTEAQSDMTRNQFKGILNQLENAVTKKDLEKPMQMIEYIGTNVTRRSLTRQMRAFLKSEFKAMTPQGAVKAKTVDGATSRVLELAKTMYATMNKLPLGGEVAALQKQMRDIKAAATEWANDQSADTKNLLADVLKVTERPAATRYSELAELRNKVAADGSSSGEMLGYIDHMLDIMGDIDYFRGEQQKAKEASALNSKEDLEALKSELLDKSDKGILSEEEKAVLDNMPLYEMMVNLRQQQLDIDGGGAASIDAQIRNKQTAIKAYRAKMNELPKTDTAGRERYKALIEQVGGEIDDLFASRIVDQKAVNNGMRELIDDLVTLKEQGHSRLVEWSKNKQKRILDVKQLANNSFSASARGYWDEVNKSGHRLRDINNFLNNAKLTMISPALSFEYMLGTLDKKYYTNDSPIYNRFIKSQDGLLKANDNFFEGLEAYNKEVNEAANRLIGRGAITDMAEWFKLGDRFATEEIPFAFEVDRMFDDGTVRKVTKGITATMTRGQAAKIYAWSRMADGMAKLEAHGVTDETIAAVKDFIGEGYMNFVDWVEDDFFPRLRREKYNPKYKEIYGISMAENEHYFPFAIYKKDVRTNTDLEQIGDDKLGGGLVGNLIERKRNNARLDFTRNSPDIFDMITRYGETMEEWTAYAQVREDLKAMVNDKMFKTKCDMFGTDYYKHFLEAARVASRTSDDKALAGKWNTSMSKLQKVLASAAISMRVSTALKQLLSAPAFAVYSLDPKFLHQLEKTVVPIDVESAIKGLWKIGSGDLQEAKKLLLNENWVGHYNWCVNNLPSFRERVSLGGAGNPILEEKGFGKLCDAVQSAGMIPNRLVDAFTCSVGAKAIYEYNFNKYKKMYGEKAAHNMAVTEAEIAFNSSQQSSNPVFLSPMQVSKQFFLRGLMNFKNSPIGYLRAGMKANTDMVRAIKSIYNPTFKVDGQEMRFNSNGKNAASMLMTAAARSAMYNFFLNFIWNLGTVGIAGLSYTAMRNLSGEGSEDGNLLYTDEEWKKATGDNPYATLFLCATQGIPYISGPFATAEQGTEFAPLMLLNTLNEMGTDIYQSGLVSPVTAQWITNIALKNGAGIDPQVCAQVYEGLQGILADRPVTEEDIMNLLASPRSAISGITKQKVGEYDRMRDYVNARIKSNREIGIDERMDFGKALAGKRELRKSNLDYYIDEYLEANIPGYREISGRKSKETKQEEQANKKLYEQSMSLVEKIVSTPKEADEQKTSKIDSKDEDIKYMVRRLRDAVAAIHKLYAAGDYSTAEDIAAEMQRRIERGYDPNGKTLDERLKNVDIWEPVGEVTQDSPDGYYTNFDRAIGGEFKKTYVGKMNGEGN